MDSDGEMTSLSSSPSFSSPSSSSSSSPPCPFSFGSSSPSSPFAEAVFDGGLEVFFEEAREEARGEAAAEAGVWEKIKKTITSMFLYGSTVVPHRRYIWWDNSFLKNLDLLLAVVGPIAPTAWIRSLTAPRCPAWTERPILLLLLRRPPVWATVLRQSVTCRRRGWLTWTSRGKKKNTGTCLHASELRYTRT